MLSKYTDKELAEMAQQILDGIANDDPQCEILIMFIAAHCNMHPVEVGRRIMELAEYDSN